MNDVGRIDAGLNARIEPHFNHPPQPSPMAVEQLVDRAAAVGCFQRAGSGGFLGFGVQLEGALGCGAFLMITVSLQIRCSDRSQRATVGWFVLGDDPGQWLDEMLGWGVPLAGLTLRVVPRFEGRAGGAAGVLVTGGEGLTPVVSAAVRPYGCEAGRLYLPVEARFDPLVGAVELNEWLPSPEDSYVWHPAGGLIGFGSGETLRVVDLLGRPEFQPADWSRAVPGTVLNSRLASIEPDEPPTAADVLESGRGDIGSQAAGPDRPSQLPPAPGEPNVSWAAQAGRYALVPLAAAVHWLSQLAPPRASHPTWIDGLADWARGVLAAPLAGLASARERELHRLMHLLNSNPDEGLRYALPMGSGGHRGQAPPSSQLGRHDVNFDLGRLGGGGAADFWDVPFEVLQQLRAQYREIAGREMRLGRHRRAAYIFAELLGDLTSAAAALQAGGYHREAAVLYRGRLNQPWAAARCLEAGGLWEEAAALYEELGADVDAGDLYHKLDLPEEAEAAYRRAVGRYVRERQYAEAARLLEEKLDAPDEALAAYEAGWPDSPQAARCLRDGFELLARLGRHEQARGRIEAVRRNPRTRDATLLAAEVLTGTAQVYPDPQVQHLAADTVRILGGEQLPTLAEHEARRLLAALGRLAPEDRLLPRDCDRYLQRKYSRPPAAARRRTELQMVGSFELDWRFQWKSAAASNDALYVAGYCNAVLVVQRVALQPHSRSVKQVLWNDAAFIKQPAIHLTADCREVRPLHVHLLWGPSLPARYFLLADRKLPVCTPHWHHDGVLGAARGPNGVSWMVDPDGDNWVLNAYDAHGAPMVSTVLDPSERMMEFWGRVLDADGGHGISQPFCPLPIPVHARELGVSIGMANGVLSVEAGGNMHDVELPALVRGLTGSHAQATFRLAATFEHGAAVVWRQPIWRVEKCPSELSEPAACFTRGGHLVLVSTDGLEVYDTNEGRLRYLAAAPGVPSAPLTVAVTAHRDEFAVCTASGEIRVYRVIE